MLSAVAAGVRSSLSVIEQRHSHDTVAHEDRVGRLCLALGTALGLSPGHCDNLYYAAGLHDVGKLGVPAALLEKPALLAPDERQVICGHARFGWEILRGVADPLAAFAADIALQHHEHWDGSGYPAGLKREAILPEARIVTLCDVYDSIRGARAYKAPVSHEQAMRIILHGAPDGRTDPSMFDPALLAVVAADSTMLRNAFDAVGQ